MTMQPLLRPQGSPIEPRIDGTEIFEEFRMNRMLDE
jgi:hypothetical protein